MLKTLLCSMLLSATLCLGTVAVLTDENPAPVMRIDTDMGMASAWVIDCDPVVTEDGIVFDVTVATAGHFIRHEEFDFFSGELVMVENPGPYTLTFPNGLELCTEEEARVHPTEDFALLTFRSSSYHEPRALDPRALQYGERLFLDGFPAGEGPYHRDGYSGGADRTSTPAWPGDSGGPITDADGEVVGILIQVIASPQGFVSFAGTMTRLTDINEWLQEQLN